MSHPAVIQLRGRDKKHHWRAGGMVMRVWRRVDGCAVAGSPLSRTAGTTGDSCGF
jgi:hypothetical protein